MANYSYVKFQRGTLRAFQNLRNKDPDTLYFIYNNDDSSYGSLYLGDKLISGGEITTVSAALSDLSDIDLSNPQSGQILSYNTTSGKWENLDLAQAIENANISVGAKIDQVNPESYDNDLDALASEIANPTEGEIAFVGDNVYIYNGDSWQLISGIDSASSSDISLLQSEVSDLQTLLGHPSENDNPSTGLFATVDTKITESQANSLIAAAVGNLNHLSYRQIPAADLIDLYADNANQFIYLVPKEVGSLNNVYDEYLVIDNSLEKIGQFEGGSLTTLEATVSNLNDIINGTTATDSSPAVPGLVNRVTVLESAVGDLTQLYNYNVESPTTIVNTINEINERLVWNSIEDLEAEESGGTINPDPDAETTPVYHDGD